MTAPAERNTPPCPLCDAAPLATPVTVERRRFFECPACGLTFLDPDQRPTPEAELAHYKTHDNRPDDPRYRAFLDRLALPLAARLAPGSRGLDYGCGPGPTLSLMLSERGFPTVDYDPFFVPVSHRLEAQYDFVTCTETAEHFHTPAVEFARLAKLVRPGGVLGLMTVLRDSAADLGSWWYLRDPTHVSLYRRRTFGWIAERWDWQLEFASDTVILLERVG